MKGTRSYLVSYLLAATLAACAVVTAACGSGTAASAGAPPASSHTAAEKAATLNWLAKTNQMWTRNDFAMLDQVTTSEMRAVYQSEEQQETSTGGSRKPLQLTGLSITIPCQSSGSPVFVAYGDTDVVTLGQGLQPVAMVFEQAGSAWKLAAIVQRPSGSSRWPALCRQGTATTAPAILAPGGYAPDLARVLTHAATGVHETAAAAAPFAVNSFFSGPDSFTVQSATQIRQDRAGGVTLAERFSPTADPTLALPLAGGRGYWLIGVLTQTATYSSAAGIRKDTLPDGASIAGTRPGVVHHATDTYITTYTAIDPLRSHNATVALDGFFGWQLTGTAS
ncbi:MAG: hypothetical protein WAK82_42280 [Streptosporangiaceae bacterium]